VTENDRLFILGSGAVAVVILLVAADVGGWLGWVGHADTETSIWTMVLALAGVASLVVVVRTARTAVSALADAKKTRHGQLVTDLSRRWDESLLVESQDFYSEIGPRGIIELADRVNVPRSVKNAFSPEQADGYRKDVADFNKLLLFPSLLDTIGVLVDEDVIDAEVVYKLWGPVIALTWRTWSSPVDELRTAWGRPSAYRYFQSVGEAMGRLEANDLAGHPGAVRLEAPAGAGARHGSTVS
jgi:hypothetical protein